MQGYILIHSRIYIYILIQPLIALDSQESEPNICFPPVPLGFSASAVTHPTIPTPSLAAGTKLFQERTNQSNRTGTKRALTSVVHYHDMENCP